MLGGRMTKACRILRTDNRVSACYCLNVRSCMHDNNGPKRVQMNSNSKKNVGKVAAISLEAATKHYSSQQVAIEVLNLPISQISVLVEAMNRAFARFQSAQRRKYWKLQAEMLIEGAVTGCKSLTLIAVAGSLMGSILCFLEGIYFVIQSFIQYFTKVSRSEQQKIMQLLIEALDMFLVGSAMLTFGIGLYTMFNFCKGTSQRWHPTESNLFGLFNLMGLPGWMKMQSISQAKTKIGHAILLLLQAGVLDKFKNVPLVNGFDLACFAGAILVSSASIFLLSKLTTQSSSSSKISSHHISQQKAHACS